MLQTHHYQFVIEKKNTLNIGINLNQKENKYYINKDENITFSKVKMFE